MATLPTARGAALIAITLLAGATHARAAAPCRIEVVERGSGWPVPMVELRTTHGVSFFTDNAGVAAFDLPEMLGREIWLEVAADGYEVADDGLGFRGVRLTPEPGGMLRVEVDRTSIAKRLGRLTGAGLFAESQECGGDGGWRESGVTGCDSLQLAASGGRLFWLWGDTTLPDRPLGLFHCSGATTPLKPLDCFEPPMRVSFDIFRDEHGRPRNIAELPGDGPTWLTGLVSLPGNDGCEHLAAAYMKVRKLDDIHEWGLAVWDGGNFRPHRVVWRKSDDSSAPPPMPAGHAIPWTDEDGNKWVLFGHPFPSLKCPANFEAWGDPDRWESLDAPSALAAADGSGDVRPADGPHTGSVAWNAFRKKWIAVIQQSGGTPSPLGEIWYAEADSPLGPWGPAVKVLSHRKHTFYNVRQHPELVPPDAPFILFEGTHTAAFAPGASPVPRHDYNQIVYRLDLNDPRLAAAQDRRPGG